MAPERDGRRAARGRSSESKEMTEGSRAASSDDDAPDEVTFEDSKAAALRSARDAAERARRDEEALREKRRRRQALFEEQKKRRRLPEEVLREIGAAGPGKPAGPEGEGGEELSDVEETFSGLEESGSQEEDDEQEGMTVKKKKGIKKRRMKGGYIVMTLKDQSRASRQQRNAAEFLQSRLYSPQSSRTTVNHFLSLENKRALKKGAATMFASKEWGKARKEKAENFKKRWLHKRRVEVS